MLHKLFIHIIIVLWIWSLLSSGLNRSFSVMLYWLILFWYLYCHLSGFIDWFGLVVSKLDKSKFFKSIIFNFFAVLLSFFFYINIIPLYMPFNCFASDGLSAAEITLLFCLSFISFLCLCCFYCAQCQHHDLYVYFCWFNFFLLFQFIFIYFSSLVCVLIDLGSICC